MVLIYKQIGKKMGTRKMGIFDHAIKQGFLWRYIEINGEIKVGRGVVWSCKKADIMGVASCKQRPCSLRENWKWKMKRTGFHHERHAKCLKKCQAFPILSLLPLIVLLCDFLLSFTSSIMFLSWNLETSQTKLHWPLPHHPPPYPSCSHPHYCLGPNG